MAKIISSNIDDWGEAIKVAVVGTGSIGSRHLEVLRGMGQNRAIAVPKRPERVRELETAGFVTARHLDDAIKKGAKFCIIASDTASHVEDGLSAIERGLEVLVEKPLAPNAQEARRLNERAREAGRRISVGCVLRFSESLNTFRELLPEVGPLHSVRIECQSYLPDWRPARTYQESYSARLDEGGVLLDLVHEIDYAAWLFGWPASVQARVRNLGILGIASDEIAAISWETSNGCMVSISLDYLSRPPHRGIRACGRRGTILWDAIKKTVKLMGEGAPAKKVESLQATNEMFLAQTRAFINRGLGINEPRLATGDEGVKALAVCDATRQASASKKEEKVEYID